MHVAVDIGILIVVILSVPHLTRASKHIILATYNYLHWVLFTRCVRQMYQAYQRSPVRPESKPEASVCFYLKRGVQRPGTKVSYLADVRLARQRVSQKLGSFNVVLYVSEQTHYFVWGLRYCLPIFFRGILRRHLSLHIDCGTIFHSIYNGETPSVSI